MDVYGKAAKSLWPLQPDMIFLNHGSYGATPKRVLAFQQSLRDRLEAQPCQFINNFAPGAIRNAVAEMAAFVRAEADDVGFVENTTTGINAVVNSRDIGPQDEIVIVDHVYNAVRQTLHHVIARTGASLKVVPLGLPVADDDQVLSAIQSRLTPNTALVVIDHVASLSAVVFPVRQIADICRARSIPVLVDGAHAPGMLDLDIPALGVDWYVGNCHKWLCAPKGAAILWARRDRQEGLHPTVISHDYRKGFTAEFDKIGTRDQTAWLSVPEALRFIGDLGGTDLMQRNHDVTVAAAEKLSERFATRMGAPASMFGSMATIELPGDLPSDRETAFGLKGWLWDTHNAEIHIMPFCDRLWLRISVQAYNDLDECLAIAPMVEAGIEELSRRAS